MFSMCCCGVSFLLCVDVVCVVVVCDMCVLCFVCCCGCVLRCLCCGVWVVLLRGVGVG